jgi:hypothetical protein
MSEDILLQDATAQARAIENGETSAAELVEAAIDL